MRVFVYYDVSGSVTMEEIRRFVIEAERRRDRFNHDEWLEFGFDIDVYPFEEWRNGRRTGLGGTDSQSVHEHWCANANPEDAFLLLTDGYMPAMQIPPGHGPAAVVIVGEHSFGETSPLREGRESEEWAGIEDE